MLTEDGQPQVHYSWQIVAISALSSMLLLAWFQRLPYSRTAEEKLQEAIDQQAAPAGEPDRNPTASERFMNDSPARALRARYVFPVAGKPLAGGVVTLAR